MSETKLGQGLIQGLVETVTSENDKLRAENSTLKELVRELLANGHLPTTREWLEKAQQLVGEK